MLIGSPLRAVLAASAMLLVLARPLAAAEETAAAEPAPLELRGATMDSASPAAPASSVPAPAVAASPVPAPPATAAPRAETAPAASTVGRRQEASVTTSAAATPAVPQLVLSPDMARKIGQRIWLNEAGSNRDAITSWNGNEEFASLGIGHFIWFPIGKWLPYEESFPALLDFMRKKNVQIPAWLDKSPIPANPWTSRAAFKKDFNSPELRQLRQFLLDTVAEQTQFMVARAQGAMEKILKVTPDGAERTHIVTQFARVVRASDDLYPLIDYINFKGEGTSPTETAFNKETGQRQGWGLKQVLLQMHGTTADAVAVRAEFTEAVRFILQQRVRNIPANRVFEVGWLRRVESYRRPLNELDAMARRS